MDATSGIPPYLAIVFGCVMGGAGYGPVKRWIISLRQAFANQWEHPDGQRKGSRFLFMIFATLHPAPWLLLLGIPFFLFEIAFDPLRVMWTCLLLGIALGATLLHFYNLKVAARPRVGTSGS